MPDPASPLVPRLSGIRGAGEREVAERVHSMEGAGQRHLDGTGEQARGRQVWVQFWPSNESGVSPLWPKFQKAAEMAQVTS